MRTALIGYTGFVGSNLLDAHPFDDLYNSRNIDEIRGRTYDLVVSAGNRADSHRINNDGESDRAEVDGLIEHIRGAQIDKLVLISTVCVYPGGTSPDESTALTERDLTPYGANRLHQERRLADVIDTTIIRLPQLYGARLKKGLIYDLANDYRVEHIVPDAEFQYYDVRRLWGHIELALAHSLGAVNIASPALRNDAVARDVFARDIADQQPSAPPSPFSAMYTRDMRTQHSALFGGPDGYIDSQESAMRGIAAFARQLEEEHR